jgi:hypothetical protein
MEEHAGADRILLPGQGKSALADSLAEVLDGLEIGVDQRLIHELPCSEGCSSGLCEG